MVSNKLTRLLPSVLLLVLHTRNNTDGNKLVDAKGACMCRAPARVLMKFWTYLRTRITRFSYNTAYSYAVLYYCVVYPIVAVEAIMTS